MVDVYRRVFAWRVGAGGLPSNEGQRGLRLTVPPGKSVGAAVAEAIESLILLVRMVAKFLNLSGGNHGFRPVEVAARCKSRLRASRAFKGYRFFFFHHRARV